MTMNKKDFPLFDNHSDLVYLDSAATSQKPNTVIARIKDFYENTNANVHRGIYKLSESATEEYEEARSIVASFINAESDEVVFTSGTTQSINTLSYGLQEFSILNGNQDTILLTEMEHHSNIVPWQQLAKRTGAHIEYVRLTDDFRIDQKDLHKKFKQFNVKIIAITHMSNTLGTINPIKQITQFIRKNSAQTMIVVDGAQYIPHNLVDVKDLDVDFYTFSGHKMFGPTGIGVLYGKNYLLQRFEPVYTGGGMIQKVNRESSTWAEGPEKHEAGTPNIAGAIGLAEAIKYINKIGYDAIKEHEGELLEYFLEKLQQHPELMLYGSMNTKDRGTVFSLKLEDVHAHDFAQLLDEENIAVRAGHHCNQILMQDVLNVAATVRASFCLYNDKTDIDKFFSAVTKVKDKLKS